MDLKWKKFEKKTAKLFGGKRTKGSGNQWSDPGDVKTDKFLIETKQTDKQSYSISLKTWKKISDESLFSYRVALMSILIQDIELIVIGKEDFMKLLEQIE